MNAQSGRKINLSVKASYILGMLSIGFIILIFLILLWSNLFGGNIDNDSMFLTLTFLIVFLFWGSLIFGLLGCIAAIFVLTRIREEGDGKIKRIATTGLILSILGTIIVLLLFIYIHLFG